MGIRKMIGGKWDGKINIFHVIGCAYAVIDCAFPEAKGDEIYHDYELGDYIYKYFVSEKEKTLMITKKSAPMIISHVNCETDVMDVSYLGGGWETDGEIENLAAGALSRLVARAMEKYL